MLVHTEFSRRGFLLAVPGLTALATGCGDGQTDAAESGKTLWQTDPAARLYGSQGELPLQTLEGKALLVFFGYVRCPDICPTSLSVVAQVLTGLSPEERASMRAVFVTLDPNRDQPEVLRNYVKLFHPDVLALRSTEPKLKEIAKAFRVYYVLQPPAAGAASDVYAVDHTAHTGLVNAKGRLVKLIPYGTQAEAMRKNLREVL
jgi:protein SCO1/2